MERPEVRIVAERLRLHSEEVGHATKGLVGELGRRIPDTYRNNGFRVGWSVAGWQLPDVRYGSEADISQWIRKVVVALARQGSETRAERKGAEHHLSGPAHFLG